MQISLKNYKNLLREVQKIISETEQNISQNINREKVVMSWQIGKLVDEHLPENNRAQYGKKLVEELEKDTALSKRVLYQMHSFYKAYPTLPAKEKDLSWSHYRNLSSIASKETRLRLENLATSEKLGADKLQSKISKIKSKAKIRREQNTAQKVTKLSVKRGQVFTYKIVTPNQPLVNSPQPLVERSRDHRKVPTALPTSSNSRGLDSARPAEGAEGAEVGVERGTFVDLGFNIFSKIKTSFAPETLVESQKIGGKISLKKSVAKPQQLHTYKAFLDKVVDSDTLHVTLDLGFGIEHKEILRLAKINAPEMDTQEGGKSATALQEILKDVRFLIVKTNKTDVYGRYVADVFFGKGSEQKVADSGTYLNQLLLDRGLVEVF